MPPRPNRISFAPHRAGALRARGVTRFTIDSGRVARRPLSPESGSRARRECAKLQTALKEMGDAYQFQKHAWIVETELTNTEISQRLVVVLRPTDKLLVMRIHKDWVAANVPQPELDWLSGRNYAGVGDPPLFRR